MSLNLGKDDRRAVDLLLDRTSAASNGTSGMTTFAAPGVDPARTTSAERVLQLLDLLSVEEPAADLVEQTLRRIGVAPRPMIPGMTGVAGEQTQTHA